jgi:hypothetical protein
MFVLTERHDGVMKKCYREILEFFLSIFRICYRFVLGIMDYYMPFLMFSFVSTHTIQDQGCQMAYF